MVTCVVRGSDLDEKLLNDAILAAHPDWRGTPDPMGWRDPLISVEYRPDTDEVVIEHPDADLSAIISATRGKKKLPDAHASERTAYAALGSVQAKVDFLARRMGLID
jgi:hypothetical protein